MAGSHQVPISSMTLTRYSLQAMRISLPRRGTQQEGTNERHWTFRWSCSVPLAVKPPPQKESSVALHNARLGGRTALGTESSRSPPAGLDCSKRAKSEVVLVDCSPLTPHPAFLLLPLAASACFGIGDASGRPQVGQRPSSRRRRRERGA